MSVREKILDISTLKDAMKNKDKVKVGMLRLLKSEIQRKEDGKNTLSDLEVVSIVKKNIEVSQGYITNAERKKVINEESRSENCDQEVAILESFLPKQMTEAEITTIVMEKIQGGMNNMGQIMGVFKQTYPGQADGKLVSTIVRTKLSEV
jgi:uncharacterized protein